MSLFTTIRMERKMLIEGPLKIGILDDPEQPGRELHVDFTPEFQALGAEAQSQSFSEYLQTLQKSIIDLPEADPNRAGMLIVQQIAEQLMPHLATGDLELAETIIVEMGRDHASNSLMGLLNS
jgi:hypothetical protein